MLVSTGRFLGTDDEVRHGVPGVLPKARSAGPRQPVLLSGLRQEGGASPRLSVLGVKKPLPSSRRCPSPEGFRGSGRLGSLDRCEAPSCESRASLVSPPTPPPGELEYRPLPLKTCMRSLGQGRQGLGIFWPQACRVRCVGDAFVGLCTVRPWVSYVGWPFDVGIVARATWNRVLGPVWGAAPRPTDSSLATLLRSGGRGQGSQV